MDYVLLLLDPLDKYHFYKVRDDAHIYSLNVLDLKLTDVSVTLSFSPSWKKVSLKDFGEAVLKVYEEVNIKRFYEEKEIKEELKNINIGKEFTYYFNYEKVIAIDENSNTFLCTESGYKLYEPSQTEGEWRIVLRRDVIEAIRGGLTFFRLSDMTLFLDGNNDVQALCDYPPYRQFRLSHISHQINEVIKYRGLDNTWRSCPSSYVEDLDGTYVTGLTYTNYKKMTTLNNIIIKCRHLLQKGKKKVYVGDDIIYYNDGCGKIYAKDENKNEFILHPLYLEVIKKGTINENWEKVNNFYALDLSRFHKKRCENLARPRVRIITVYDLRLYKNNNNEIFGYDKDNVLYYLDTQGDFTPLSERIEEWDFDTTENEVTKFEALITQAERKSEAYLIYYLSVVKERVQKEGCEIGESLRFFYDGKTNEVFIKDNFDNEFLCHRAYLTPIEKGTIKTDSQSLNYLEFIPYFWHCVKNEIKY